MKKHKLVTYLTASTWKFLKSVKSPYPYSYEYQPMSSNISINLSDIQ